MFHIGRRQAQRLAPWLALVCSFAGTASAAPWLTAVGETCGVSLAELEGRVSEAVAGERDPDVRVTVSLRNGSRDGSEHGATVVVRLRKGDHDLGSRRVVAPDCEEAIDAVVAVVALALSSAREPFSEAAKPRDDRVGAGSAPETTIRGGVNRIGASPAIEPTIPSSASLDAAKAGSGDAVLDAGEQLHAGDSSAAGWRALAATGLDGVPGRATGVLGAGAALQSGVSAWRAQVWYGARSFEEEAEGARSSETRSDFAAATLDYCRGVDGLGWFGVCSGVELSLARRWRSEQYENAPRQEHEALYPGASAVLGAVLAYPGARLEPRLDISARWPVVGGPAEDGKVGIRTTGGVALSIW
jgi:hypothetical protein